MSEVNETPGVPPVRVLFLSAAGQIGGAERSLYELLCALPEDRVEAAACVPPEGQLARLCALAEVPVYPVPLRRFLRTLSPFLLAGQVRAMYQASQAIRGIVEKHRIDLLHANTDSAALVAWEVSREAKVPFVWHCRDLRPLGPLAKVLAKSAAAVIAISKAVAEHLEAQGAPRERICLIENGIDVARFHAPTDRLAVRHRTRAYLGVPLDAPLLIDVGSWVPWKRHELFLEALGLVRKEMPQTIGMLVGSDLFRQNASYADFLEARALSAGLGEDALLVLQQREDVPDLLAAADVLVSPSDREPFGRVLAEAGAAGVPVVSTHSGAKAEVIRDGETGLLVPPGDAPAIAQACLTLLTDDERRARLGTNAIVRVSELFNVRRAAQEIADLYDRIVRPASSSASSSSASSASGA
ncbi:MAG: glycosyltransferase family 4 protein [Planctomycetota bacterium]|nr:glycosyltransferase family 4 protein [Planctomycetota bacterium]